MDDQVDVVDMDTACSHVRGNQDLHRTLAKGREVAVPSWLGQVSMEVNSRNTGVGQGLR